MIALRAPNARKTVFGDNIQRAERGEARGCDFFNIIESKVQCTEVSIESTL